MRRRAWKGWLVVGGLGLLLVAGPSRAQQQAPTEDPLRRLGHEDFLRLCASCHGATARGNGPVAPSLRTRPADLTRIAARRGGSFPAREVTAYIDGRRDVSAHGPREMPVWGLILAQPIHESASGEEVLRGRLMLLVEYLRSIQTDE